MKTRIFGASDDLIEIDGAISDEVNTFKEKEFECSDGTAGSIRYGDEGEWRIKIDKEGDKFLGLILSVGDDAKHIFPDAEDCTSYSDVLVLNDGIEWVRIGKKVFKSNQLTSPLPK